MATTHSGEPDARRLGRLDSVLIEWFTRHARELPWRRTLDPYAIWISEIMLQQTQVKTVVPYWTRWMSELPTAKALAEAGPDRVLKLWEGLGYYTRARNLQKAAQRIVEFHRGKFPENFDDILALPGVGRYTAGAIASIAFNQPAPILDGNVIRVLTRLFGIAENPREKATNARLWRLAESLVRQAAGRGGERPVRGSRRKCAAAGRCSVLNQSLMELGALVCTPRHPDCQSCPAQAQCVARQRGQVEALPNLGQRVATTARRFVAFVVESQGRFLVRQRPAGVINAGLWEFPNVEVDALAVDAASLLRRCLACRTKGLLPLGTVKHSITRYRISLEVFHTHLRARGSGAQGEAGRWLSLEHLSGLAFASAHRKIINRLRGSDRRSGEPSFDTSAWLPAAV